jgi:hypothetical protein
MFPKGRKQMAMLTLVGLLVVSGQAAQASGGGLPKQTAIVANEDRDTEAFFSWAWRWMRSLWEKNGPCIDPNGMCIQGGTGSTPIHPDQGVCIEPNGAPCLTSS